MRLRDTSGDKADDEVDGRAMRRATQPPSELRLSNRLPWHSKVNPLTKLRQQLQADGHPMLDLTASNPTACGLGDWSAAIGAALAQPGSACYHPSPSGSLLAREAVAASYVKCGSSVSADDFVLTASTSESYSFLFQLLCNSGDEVLTPVPSYPLFGDLAGLAGVRLRHYPLCYTGEWMLDVGSVEQALSDRTKAIIVVNPNNPTGSYIRDFEGTRLLELCAERGIALIADEVFWEYSLSGEPRIGNTWFAAAVDSPALCISLGGLSKSAGLPQMKLGWMLLRGPSELRKRVMEGLHWIGDTYLSVSAPVQEALPRLLEIGAEIQHAIKNRIAANERILREWSGCATMLSALPVEGGWSSVLRLPALRTDHDWCEILLREQRLWVQPGYFYEIEAEAHTVISLLTPPEHLAEGLRRIARAAETVAAFDA